VESEGRKAFGVNILLRNSSIEFEDITSGARGEVVVVRRLAAVFTIGFDLLA
jgi:hypothetical protein